MRRFLPLLALALVLAACDTDGIDTITPTYDPVDVTLVPTDTYLRTNVDPEATDAVGIPLDSLNIRPGDRVAFGVAGSVILDPTSGFSSRDVMGVFSDSPVLGASDQLVRVSGNLAAGRNYVSLVTAQGELPTDIPNDFRVNGGPVTVPAGATHMFIGISDAYFSDNMASGSGLRVRVVRI